ncbi:hypothetical protein HNR06_001477 [Nocardiopsis arvandica]|uniref:Uncharacterized protein n=1 Tax=Nocardiopsis sinuspersici TaxID=501010 RepID=A0A7Z0BHQ1_9ACTN|nr:hypothetical protein [Nocardiopsis sinuspersici]NYH51888.1 hypothetical protein [Nocardiopsis sinuspersici]
MSQRTQADHAPLPRRVRPGNPRPRDPHVHVHRDAPTGPDDLSALSDAVRRLLRRRPDLARPALAPGSGTTSSVVTLVSDLLITLAEVHRLALTIGAHDEAADIARLITTLRTTDLRPTT